MEESPFDLATANVDMLKLDKKLEAGVQADFAKLEKKKKRRKTLSTPSGASSDSKNIGSLWL